MAGLCPMCGGFDAEITGEKDIDYNMLKGIVGQHLLGPAGAMAGFEKKSIYICKNCGCKYAAGDGTKSIYISGGNLSKELPEDRRIKDIEEKIKIINDNPNLSSKEKFLANSDNRKEWINAHEAKLEREIKEMNAETWFCGVANYVFRYMYDSSGNDKRTTRLNVGYIYNRGNEDNNCKKDSFAAIYFDYKKYDKKNTKFPIKGVAGVCPPPKVISLNRKTVGINSNKNRIVIYDNYSPNTFGGYNTLYSIDFSTNNEMENAVATIKKIAEDRTTDIHYMDEASFSNKLLGYTILALAIPFILLVIFLMMLDSGLIK